MAELQGKLSVLEVSLRDELVSVNDLKSLEEFKVKALGKKSELYSLTRNIGELSPEERKTAGALINKLKTSLEQNITELELKLRSEDNKSKLSTEAIDTTMPGRVCRIGATHPVTQILNEIVEIFKPLGYSIANGPEIEHEFYNLDALNIPQDHPARDMQDTFYIMDNVVLRTHTSPIQARTMMQNTPPVRILAPGRVYRSDYDVTHTPMFHQIEGLYVDKGVKFSHLKGTLLYFAKRMFGEKTAIRLRPSYFPFTEPSAEVDVTCVACKGKGCRICKNTGWLEILGCGMVNPNVFKHCGYPDDVTGFAFGMGIERIAMLKYKINDLRSFFEGDVRFLRQFQ
jgi:phenylalanyl-tRNA synthetase alpha chain